MRVSLVSLGYSEYTSRLALALARHVPVQLHLVESAARANLSPQLMARVQSETEFVLHPPFRRLVAPFQGFRMARQIKAFSPDVIHIQEAGAWTVAAMLALIGRRTPVVVTMHDVIPHSGADKDVRRRDAWAFERIRMRADRVIVHGPTAARDALALYPQFKERVEIIPHGALGDFDAPRPETQHGLFVFFGRAEAYKGLAVLLEAGRRLHARNKSFRVHIAGRGSDLDARRNEIAAAPWASVDERFLPAQEAETLLQSAQCVVMPYLDATQSGVLAHAFNAGRPVIASSVGDLPEIVRHGENGLLVPPGDPEALAGAMERMLCEIGLSERLAQGAERTARSVMSWDAVAEATLNAYARAVSMSSQRRCEFPR